MNYYERHIGDYLKDTAHLSLLEHGVYTRLMDVYYTREGAIPAAEVARLVGARSKDEREALQAVLAEFFQLADGTHTQARCDREIARFKDKQAKAKRSADARWSKPETQTEGNADASPDAMRTHSEGNAPRARPQSPDTRPNTSVPDGTGASPPLPSAVVEAKPLTAKERVWLLGVPLLGDTAASRSLLGKLSKTYGEDALARVLAEATADPPAEPKAWLVAACEAAKTRTNGHHQPDMLDNPTPDWAIRAGFENRFLAESAGCGPGNFHKFAAGRRVTQ